MQVCNALIQSFLKPCDCSTYYNSRKMDARFLFKYMNALLICILFYILVIIRAFDKTD